MVETHISPTLIVDANTSLIRGTTAYSKQTIDVDSCLSGPGFLAVRKELVMGLH